MDQLVEKGLIRDYGDLYSLSKETLIPLERWAEKSADNLIQALETKQENQIKPIYLCPGDPPCGGTPIRITGKSFRIVKGLYGGF